MERRPTGDATGPAACRIVDMSDNESIGGHLCRFGTADDEELFALAGKADTLSEEACAALIIVLKSRGLIGSAREVEISLTETYREHAEAERVRQSQLSFELWNGFDSRRVSWMFAVQAVVFGTAFAIVQRHHAGALSTTAATGLLAFFAWTAGRQSTRKICANARASIEGKSRSLRALERRLRRALPLSALAGALVARLLLPV